MNALSSIVSGVGLYFVKYPVEVLAVQVAKTLQLTTVSPLIMLKTWKHFVTDRTHGAYIKLSVAVNLIDPVMEELIFRGAIQSTVKYAASAVMSPVCASVFSIGATSTLFVLPHHWFNGKAYNKSISNFVTTLHLVNGVFFGLAKELTGNVIAPMSLHVFHNLVNAPLIDRKTQKEIIFTS
jgi:membrane protease YdiL (CAAX protease family)